MRIITLPGVFQPLSDTWMLADALRAHSLTQRATVLDLCTGSGAVAIAAAGHGVRDVTAVDVSRRAIATVRINARLNGVRVDARRGKLFDAVPGTMFDAIAANPPYVPAEDHSLPDRGRARHVDGGRDGRAVLDRICAQVPARLRPGGVVLLVHSSVCGVQRTLDALAAGGLDADVLLRRRGPLGPLMTARAPLLEARGLLAAGSREEDVVVVRGMRPATDAAVPADAGHRISADCAQARVLSGLRPAH